MKMTVNKKILFILILIATPIIFAQSTDVVFGAIPTTINPGEYLDPLGKGATDIKTASEVVGIIITIVQWTYSIFFVVAVFMILMAAYTYLTAQAEPEKIKNATNQIVWASIAIAVALLAVSISAIVKSIVSPSGGGTGGTQATPIYSQPSGGGNNTINYTPTGYEPPKFKFGGEPNYTPTGNNPTKFNIGGIQ